MSAVSRNVMPSSIAASITARVPARSTRRPKLLQPNPTTEASSPESPSGRVLISLMGPTLVRPVGLTFLACAPSHASLPECVREPARHRGVLALLPERDHHELVALRPADVDELAVAEIPHEHRAALPGFR